MKYMKYNFQPDPGLFDDAFYEECMTRNNNVDIEYDTLLGLNNSIREAEVEKVIRDAKNNKAIGIDNLPYEIFKNRKSNGILTSLFNKKFESGITPSIWSQAIIKPIPKNSLIDPRLPLQYRGISLLSTTYKLFTSILNNRIMTVAENSHLYADEQNGFRKKRSCIDHTVEHVNFATWKFRAMANFGVFATC